MNRYDLAIILAMLSSPASAELRLMIVAPKTIPNAIHISTVDVVMDAANARMDKHDAKLAEHATRLDGMDLSLRRLHYRLESVKLARSIGGEEASAPAPYLAPEAEVGIERNIMPLFKASMAKIDNGGHSAVDMGTVLAAFSTLGQVTKAKAFCKKMLTHDDLSETEAMWLNRRCQGIL